MDALSPSESPPSCAACGLTGQAYSKPPALVDLALSGVVTVLRRPGTWEEAKKQLGDANFMSKLLHFDKVRWRGTV